MPEPFAQPERRSFLTPILLAIAALAVVAAIAIYFFPATTVKLTHIHTDLLAEDAVFKSDSIVLGINETAHVLYIAATIRVDNQLRVPISLDGFTLTFTNPGGAELTARAFTADQLPNLEFTYPALKTLLVAPLPRDTSIDPGKSAQGAILFALPIPQAMWDQRNSAVIHVGLYRQPAVDLIIPKS